VIRESEVTEPDIPPLAPHVRRPWMVMLCYIIADNQQLLAWRGIILNATPAEVIPCARKVAGITAVESGGLIESLSYSDGEESHELMLDDDTTKIVEEATELDQALGTNLFIRDEPIEDDAGMGAEAARLFDEFTAPLEGTDEAYGGAPEGAHFRVEFDLGYWGGNYSGTGDAAFVPFSLLHGPERLTPHEAFTKFTGHIAAHIVHYTLDDLYDADGKPLDA
jgi:hypothetical protein